MIEFGKSDVESEIAGFQGAFGLGDVLDGCEKKKGIELACNCRRTVFFGVAETTTEIGAGVDDYLKLWVANNYWPAIICTNHTKRGKIACHTKIW